MRKVQILERRQLFSFSVWYEVAQLVLSSLFYPGRKAIIHVSVEK